MESFNEIAHIVLIRLAWTSAQAALLVGLVALLIRLVPRLSAASRCLLWWLVGLQLMVGLACQLPVELRLLSPEKPTMIAGAHLATAHPADVALSMAFPSTPMTTAFPWSAALMALWLAALAVQLVLAGVQWWQVRGVVRDSRPVDDHRLQALCDARARRLGLRRPPVLRVADGILSPHVVGLWRPTVVLPTAETLSSTELELALDHELAHLRRGDLWLGWVPALAQRLFFFHPLVRWAMREYALSREEACDVEVLNRNDADPAIYGRLLLRLGVQPAVCSGLATASPTFKNLKRRLIMLHKHASEPRQGAFGWIIVGAIALAGVVPYRVTAGVTTTTVATSTTSHPSGHGVFDIQQNSSAAYALFDGDTQYMSGTGGDMSVANQARKSGESMLWIRQGSKTYIVRDAATLARMRAMYAPQMAISRRQTELGAKQADIGRQEAAIGQQQAVIGQKEASIAQAGAMKQSQAGIDMQARSLAMQQQVLNTKQAELNARQEGLSKELKEATTRADGQIADLVKQAIASGAAREQGGDLSER
jgi:bla regulator protein blaR1